ncbi:MAG: hypothetical protein M1831_006933 [Alyxoria varia]|nr:MAG: hypothetical protein M1831_006933 [Alyxoria varia]
MSSSSWEYIAKIVSLGDSGCGKSSLTIRLCEGRFTTQHDVTIGVEFGSRIIPVGLPASRELGINDPTANPTLQATSTLQSSDPTSKASPKDEAKQKHMKLSLWDTAGQETYRAITRSYLRGAAGALLVFDKSRRKTFENVTDWLLDLRQISEEGVVIVLVGNKSDLASASADLDSEGRDGKSGQVTTEEAEAWCRQNNVMRYVETSAKTGEGVERAFLEVAERIFQRIEAGKYDLNDRRSGVKGAGGGNTAKTINLGMKDPADNQRNQAGCAC